MCIGVYSFAVTIECTKERMVYLFTGSLGMDFYGMRTGPLTQLIRTSNSTILSQFSVITVLGKAFFNCRTAVGIHSE